MILSREAGERIRQKKAPPDYEWSKKVNGVIMYFKKSTWPNRHFFWSYIHNKWILDW